MSRHSGRQVLKVGPLLTHQVEDRLVEESPMELRMMGIPIAVLMRTPGQEEDLALGFAITEGIVDGPAEVARVQSIGSGDRYELMMAAGVEIDPEQFRRNTYTSSSCGGVRKGLHRCGADRLPPVAHRARAHPKDHHPASRPSSPCTGFFLGHRRIPRRRLVQPRGGSFKSSPRMSAGTTRWTRRSERWPEEDGPWES